jgi:hypothetical protein
MAEDDSTTSGEMWSGGSALDPSQQVPSTPTQTPDSKTAQAPPSSQVPEDNSDDAKAIRQDIDSNRALQSEILEAHKKTMGEFEKNQQMIQEAQQKLQETLKMQADSDPVPQIDNPTREQRMAGVQTNTTWPSIIGSLGMMLAGALGGKGHHASITSMSFLGAMMQSYTKGQTEARKQQLEEWWKQMEYNHQVIQDRLANYRAALQDKRLNTQQALELFKTYVSAYGDVKYEAAAQRGDLNTINKQLVQDELALNRLKNEAHKTQKSLDTLTKSNTGKAYEDEAFERWSMKHGGYLPYTPQEKAEARSQYPMTQFLKEQKVYQKDPKTGEEKIVPKYPTERDSENHLFKNPPHQPGESPQGGNSGEDNYGKSLAPDSMDGYFNQ